MAQPDIPQPDCTLIRRKCCRGCLYSANPVAGNAEAARAMIDATPAHVFRCHHKEDGTVVCAGFYARHPERVDAPAFTDYEHRNFSVWGGVEAGAATYRYAGYRAASEEESGTTSSPGRAERED